MTGCICAVKVTPWFLASLPSSAEAVTGLPYTAYSTSISQPHNYYIHLHIYISVFLIYVTWLCREGITRDLEDALKRFVSLIRVLFECEQVVPGSKDLPGEGEGERGGGRGLCENLHVDTNLQTYIHSHIYIHTYIHVNYTNIHAYMRTYMHAYIHSSCT